MPHKGHFTWDVDIHLFYASEHRTEHEAVLWIGHIIICFLPHVISVLETN
jgi:hypothetical protein